MRLIARSIFREVTNSAVLGTILFTFVLFLQRIGKLFEILVRSSAPPQVVAQLFGMAIPFTLKFTVPCGVLVGVLIALSRMSGDGEIIALRAAGVPSRKVMAPVLTLATLGMLVTATATLWLTPLAAWKTYRIVTQLEASELTAEVQPHVFDEQFPNRIVYIGDVIPGTVTRWRNIFIADTTPPEERKNQAHDRGDSPLVTVASEGIAIPDVPHNQIQLTMKNESTLEVAKDNSEYYHATYAIGTQVLEATKPSDYHPKDSTQLDTLPLYRIAYKDPKVDPDKRIEARIEFHQRIALPPACFLLALIGIPLGVSSHKGSKSMAFVVTVILAFVYWLGLLGVTGLAKQQKLPVGIAMWIPDAVFAVMGIILISRLDRPGDRDFIGAVTRWLQSLPQRLRGALPAESGAVRQRRVWRLTLLPQVVDAYVLTTFLFYFVVLLASLVAMVHVYTFFELLNDIVKNKITMFRVLTYLFYLTPHLIYDSAPMSALVAVLVTLGVLTKHNEVIAFKACGVSLYRLSVPILLVSLMLSGALFAFDHYYIPDANRKQDAIRNEIKGRPVQTYLHPERKFIYGQGSRIYYYKYLDGVGKAMAGVNVYELDPGGFGVLKHISAEKAHWEPALKTWIFENGFWIDFNPGHPDRLSEKLHSFLGAVMTFSEVSEPPDYFLKESVQDKQMNFQQLASYIKDLQQSGFDTVALQVQFYRKFSVPLFVLIMALIAIPFAFLTGNRGAMAGVGVSFGIAIAYWAVSQLSEQLGDINLLPATMSAWAPDALFAMAGFYFFTRMRT